MYFIYFHKFHRNLIVIFNEPRYCRHWDSKLQKSSSISSPIIWSPVHLCSSWQNRYYLLRNAGHKEAALFAQLKWKPYEAQAGHHPPERQIQATQIRFGGSGVRGAGAAALGGQLTFRRYARSLLIKLQGCLPSSAIQVHYQSPPG